MRDSSPCFIPLNRAVIASTCHIRLFAAIKDYKTFPVTESALVTQENRLVYSLRNGGKKWTFRQKSKSPLLAPRHPQKIAIVYGYLTHVSHSSGTDMSFQCRMQKVSVQTQWEPRRWSTLSWWLLLSSQANWWSGLSPTDPEGWSNSQQAEAISANPWKAFWLLQRQLPSWKSPNVFLGPIQGAFDGNRKSYGQNQVHAFSLFNVRYRFVLFIIFRCGKK